MGRMTGDTFRKMAKNCMKIKKSFLGQSSGGLGTLAGTLMRLSNSGCTKQQYTKRARTDIFAYTKNVHANFQVFSPTVVDNE